MHRTAGLVPVLAVVVAAMLAGAPAEADPSPEPVTYRAPVPGPGIDPYRPPSTPYGPGNRGIDYATTPGEDVGAPADGEVTFAGAVGGGLHVVLLHADGIRTSLSFLAAVLVRRGQRVGAGQAVGRAGATLHFGARRGEAYLDPAGLLAGSASGARAFLVPEGPGRPLGSVDEAAGLGRLLAGERAAPAAATPAHIPGRAARTATSPRVEGAAAALRAAAPLATPPAGGALLAACALRVRGRRHRSGPLRPARSHGRGPGSARCRCMEPEA